MLELNLTGACRVTDANDDWRVDRLVSGNWAGTMTYDTIDAQLAQPATFSGTRL